MSPQKHVLLIGSGLGSLATALRLTTKGFKVTILEKHHQAGGRLNQLKKDGFTFDVGPSFFSMSYEFKELFEDCKVPELIEFNELDPIYTVYFSNRKKPFHIYKNLEKLAKEFQEVEPDFVRKAEKYLKKAGDIFHDTEYKIVKANYNGKLDYLAKLTTVPFKHLPALNQTMWKNLENHFDSYEVRVIFSLVSFFLGGTPFETPSVYSLLNYTELKHDGYWNVKGGMYTIVEKLVTELQKRQVEFVYNTEIVSHRSSNGNVDGFIDKNGKIWTADLYVVNSDAAAFRGQIFNRKKFTEEKLDKMEWTLAPFTIYLGINGKVDGLHHHNYFLRDNFTEYANKIFKTSTAPQKPYYYVNVTSKSNDNVAPDNCENIFILCPVPDLRFKQDWSDSEQFADDIIADMSERLGFDFKKNTISRTIYNPIEWKNKFNLYKGSGLGLGHNLMQVGGMRPSNKDEEFSNVYYVGASTTPGTGLPIVVIGSKLVTERMMSDVGTI